MSFVRFQHRRNRTIVSLVASTRVGGRVRQEHVAALGAIAVAPTIADRVEFWARLHQRLARLSNRLDAAAAAKIMGDVHARVPMPTPDEQRALQLENAQTDAKVAAALHDIIGATVAGKQEIRAKLDRDIADETATVSEAAADLEAAEARVAAIQRGETVAGGFDKPTDLRAALKATGMTEADLRDCRLLAEIPEEHFDEFMQLHFALVKPAERRLKRRAAIATLLKHGLVR